MPVDRESRKPVVRRARLVPRAHARELDRVEKSLIDRVTQLTLANAHAEIDAQRAAILEQDPGARLPAVTLRRRRSRALSRQDAVEMAAAGGRSHAAVSRELTKDVRRLRRVLVDTVRRGQHRPLTVGDPTTFLCSLIASSISTTQDTYASPAAFTTLTPIATGTGTGTNRARFLGSTFSPVELLTSAILQITQYTRFTFSTGIASSVSLTVHLAPVGTYRIDAPSKVFIFPFWHAVPHPSLFLNAAVTAVASWPVPLGSGSSTTVTTTTTSAVSLLNRELSGWNGPTSESGLLQGVAAPATITLPSFAVGAGATVTLSVVYFLKLVSNSGGLVTVDCLSNASAGLNVPGVILRMDY